MKPVPLTLVLSVGLSSVLLTWGLQFHVESTQDNLNDQLTCSMDTNQSDTQILSMIDISITDFTHPRKKLKLASASILQPDLYVQHTRNIKMEASGSVSQHQAKLNIKFSKETPWELGSYLCELTFINLAGQIGKKHAAKTAELPDDISPYLFNNSELALLDQLSATANQLADAMSQMNDAMNQLAVATTQMNDATKQITNAVNVQADIKNLLTCRADQLDEILVQFTDRFTDFETVLVDRMTNLPDSSCPQNRNVVTEQYFDLMDTGENKWRLAFRGTANISQSVFKAYTQGTVGVNIEPGCKQVAAKIPCNNHYRNNDVLDEWQNIDEVALVLYAEGIKVKQIVFDAAGTTFMNWFQKDKVKNSSWDDLTTTATYNFFSIAGDSGLERRFFINSNYGGCDADAGWFVAYDRRPRVCTWEHKETFPIFLYSRKTTKQNWTKGDIGIADVMAVFVKYHTS